MNKSFSNFVEIADKAVFNDDRIASYFDIVQKSTQDNKVNSDQLISALAVEIRSDILHALKTYHDWISS